MLLEGNLQGVQHLGIPVVDIEACKSWYAEKLGFEVVHEPAISTDEGEIKIAFLVRDGLTLEFYQLVGDALDEVRARKHGHIDHFALDVVDIDAALEAALDAGAVMDEATPDGPAGIPQFWSQGVKYIFLKGPGGEKVELNQRLDLDPGRRTENLGGWSHLGVPVTDIDRSREFYSQFGFEEVMYAEIPVEDQAIKASMMDKGGFVLEFYQLLGDDLAEIGTRQDGFIDHIAFDVLDADKAFQEVSAAGLEPLEESPVPLPFWDKGVKYFNVRGPDGEKVEFNERIK